MGRWGKFLYSGCSFSGLLLFFASYHLVTFFLLVWDTSTLADKNTLITLTSFQKSSFHYLLSSFKLPVEDTTGRLWGGCGSLSGRYEWTGQCKPRIINTYWALTNIYKSQKETVESISETSRTFQAVCKMSPSVPPTPHPLKLQSYVIRVAPNRLRQKTILSFI